MINRIIKSLHKDEESRVRAIVDTVLDGIITIDDTGIIETFNPAAEHLFGYAAAEVIGHNINCLMPSPYQKEHDEYIANYLSSGDAKVIGVGREVVGRCKDGSTFPMELAVSEMQVAGRRMFTGIVRDISERKKAESELKDRESRVRAIVDTVLDGIITIDDTGIIETFNPAAEHLFGYTAAEVIGHNINCLMPSPYQKEHDEYIANYLSSGDAKVIGVGREVVGRCKDGSTFPMELAVSEMQVAGRRMFTGIVRDISERKKAESLMVIAKEKAEESNRLKTDFINMISHELRTPLTVMMGNVPLLCNPEELDGMIEIAEIAEDIKYSGNHLLELINDLLDFSKIEAGKLDLNFQLVELKPFIERIVLELQALASNKNLRLMLNVEATQLCVDPVRLKQILINLIGNAIKFTEQGEILVTAKEHNTTIIFTVKDTGIGIDEEDIPIIFDVFRQVDGSYKRVDGSGLGLSITKKLITMHNGQISVTSKTGEGSTFSFYLPKQQQVSAVK